MCEVPYPNDGDMITTGYPAYVIGALSGTRAKPFPDPYLEGELWVISEWM